MKNEQNLNSTDNIYFHFFNHANDPMVIYEAESGMIIESNQSFINLFELWDTKSQFIHDLISEIPSFSTEEKSFTRSEVEVLLKCTGEKSSGKVIDLKVQYNLFHLNDRIHILAVCMEENPSDNIQYKNTTVEDLIKEREELKLSVAEKNYFIKEIHHRVKNNMQIISSLLHMQELYVKNPEIASYLQESENRIQSMAKLHELLYESDNLLNIDIHDYFRMLSQFLIDCYKGEEKGINLHLDVDSIFIDVDKAVPLGLIVNELLTNALKYAYNGKNGTLTLNAHKIENNNLFLQIKDEGAGFPDFIDPEKPLSLGLQLVHSLTDQLEGKIQFISSEGTEINIMMPLSTNH